MSAARSFVTDYPQPEGLVWFVDDMQNSFNTAYASWPFRFWVFLPPRLYLTSENPSGANTWWVGFKSMPQDMTYHIGELDTFLQTLSCDLGSSSTASQ